MEDHYNIQQLINSCLCVFNLINWVYIFFFIISYIRKWVSINNALFKSLT